MRNSVKASNLPVSKLGQLWHSELSHTKFTIVRRKFKRTEAFARLKDETSCMDVSYVNKLAEDNYGVKYLLVRQNLFDRTVEAKRMKGKDSKQTVHAVLTKIKKEETT